MPDTNNYDDDFNAVLVENTAQTVFKRLDKLRNQRERFKRRWIWELLQNASDAAGKEGVRIEIQLTENELRFGHDGQPFEIKNIGHLIYHGSTKQEDEDSAGQFGTGFITTHLLSDNVQVKGRLADGQFFDFVLCREGSNAEELRQSMDQSRHDFENSLSTADDDTNNSHTQFIYPITGDVRIDIVEALEDLKKFLPYVFAFNEKIVELTISGIESFSMAKGNPEQLDHGFVKYPIGPLEALSEPKEFVVTSDASSRVRVGMLLKEQHAKLEVSIAPDTPRIFVFFPLVGTERFAFPAIVSSSEFHPTEERDGINLWKGDTEKNRTNQQLITEAIESVLQLASMPAIHGWLNPHQLANLQLIVETEWLGVNEYRSLIREKLLPQLRKCKLLVTSSGEFIAPADASIPVPEHGLVAKDIWQIASRLQSHEPKLPDESFVDNWHTIISDWASIEGQEPTDFDEAVSLEAIAHLVDELETIHDLNNELIEGADVFDWLNDLFNLIGKADLGHLFDDLKLLPNQLGTFRSRNLVEVDNEIDEQLKLIADKLNVPGRKQLLANEIKSEYLLELLDQTDTEDLLRECLNEIKQQARSKDTDRDEFAKVNASIIAWCVDCEYFDELDDYPVITRKNDKALPDCVFKLDSNLAVDDDIPLFPQYSWPEKSQKFVDIFPERFVISDEYQKIVTSEHWKFLGEHNYLRTSFLIELEGTTSHFFDDSALVTYEENGRVESKTTVEQRQLVFLSNPNFGIIEKIRKNKERAVCFLEFAFSFLLIEEKFDVRKVQCSDDVEREYLVSGWVSKLLERRWIPYKKRSSNATAESIGDLIRGRSEIVDLLSLPGSRKFLQAIGVGIADLSLHTLAEDEESRVSLMGSFSEIVKAADHDTDRIRRVADELAKSPQLLDKIEDHTRNRERVEKNQFIGFKVEALLRDALSATGLKVTRTAIGSDYEAESDLIDDENEQAINIAGDKKSVLIEIKSSRSDKVGMTVTQARMAVEQKHRFMLCVVIVDSNEDLTEEKVKLNAVFLTDIGERLSNAVEDFEAYEITQESTRGETSDKDIEIDISDSETRFRVSVELVKKHGLDFDSAVEHIRASC